MTSRNPGAKAAGRLRLGRLSLWLACFGGAYLLVLSLGAPILGAMSGSSGSSEDPAILRFIGALTLAAPLVLILQILAIVLGAIPLFRRGDRRPFALLGLVLGVLVTFSFLGWAVYLFSEPLNTPEADPGSPVVGPPPPKQNPPPPKSTLSSEERAVSADPTFWCKYVQSTMFCEGHEELPLPPANRTLQVPTGTTLLFDYGGDDKLKTSGGGMSPPRPPINVGGVRLGEEWEARSGPDGLRVLENERGSGRLFGKFEVRRTADEAENRSLVDRPLEVGEYVIRFYVLTPGGEAYYHFRVRVEAKVG